MVRTLAEIRAEMIAAKNSETVLAPMNITSLLSKSRLWIYVVSTVIWTIENILDISISDQNKTIKSQKIHSLSWYSDVAKKFQYGFDLPVGEVDYNNEGVSDEDIEVAQKVKYASTSKVPGGLKMKIAGIISDELAPLAVAHYDAFVEYMSRVKAAGDNITFVNDVADHLRLSIKIFRDPLVLDANGKRTDGTNDTPVQDAIDAYLKGMDFDKKFIPAYLIDKIQEVEGVVVPNLELAQSQYALLPYTAIPPEGVLPHSGYLRLYNISDLELTYDIWQG